MLFFFSFQVTLRRLSSTPLYGDELVGLDRSVGCSKISRTPNCQNVRSSNNNNRCSEKNNNSNGNKNKNNIQNTQEGIAKFNSLAHFFFVFGNVA
ncbi:GATA zinc finger domain-containing protein 8-like [Stomoxys calcitrans]|uniref:GATA zinc finger domain-containing protein 8-like n=1 Tax=Stomoxys calcitrans TaxID=35570 RepID=UPI0027E2FB0B|nr:GATA zinc finger domain-containing protein 8-like [Stomoxys calcitrans]